MAGNNGLSFHLRSLCALEKDSRQFDNAPKVLYRHPHAVPAVLMRGILTPILHTLCATDVHRAQYGQKNSGYSIVVTRHFSRSTCSAVSGV
jgi:hypothetical protein